MALRSWKRVQKGSLIGIAGISMPVAGSWLDVDDVAVLMSSGRAWATWPGKPVLTKEGTVAKLPGSSKTHFVNILKWRDRGTPQRWSQAVIDLVKAADPAAFDGAP
jgi:hypothetical protein